MISYHILINLIFINLFVSLVYYLNAPQEMTDRFVEIFTKGKVKRVELKKPFSCSTCICNYLSFFYLLIVMPIGSFILICLLAVLNGFLTKLTTYAIQLMDQLVSHLAMLFERLINKIR